MEVDLVVLWVDGNDPKWLEERNRCSQEQQRGSGAYLFRDWGLMKYWFRAIEAYIPWYRRLHFVTWGHLPEFLNPDHPKLHIVRHQDFMPPESLPCFNSMALEMNIFRIPDLAEHFIYFNDDTFITRPMEEGRFFDGKSGLPALQFIEQPRRLMGKLDAHAIVCLRGLGVINQWFPKRNTRLSSYPGKFLSFQYSFRENLRNILLKLMFPTYYAGFKEFHLPVPYLKSTFEEIWEKEPQLLEETTLQHFRSGNEVNQYLAKYWQIVSGRFVPRRLSGFSSDIRDEKMEMLTRRIRGQEQEMLCLNDSTHDVTFDACARGLQEAFEQILPGKCSFER